MVFSVMARLTRQPLAVVAVVAVVSVVATVKRLKRQYWHKGNIGQAFL
jgi:hypothetical protein